MRRLRIDLVVAGVALASYWSSIVLCREVVLDVALPEAELATCCPCLIEDLRGVAVVLEAKAPKRVPELQIVDLAARPLIVERFLGAEEVPGALEETTVTRG